MSHYEKQLYLQIGPDSNSDLKVEQCKCNKITFNNSSAKFESRYRTCHRRKKVFAWNTRGMITIARGTAEKLKAWLGHRDRRKLTESRARVGGRGS